MQFLNQSFPEPDSNIALDEALLESAESGVLGESLRVWESPVYFAVLGYSSTWKNELNPNTSIPFIRRKSGGQTVLQGPGCLNFNLVLKVNSSTGIRTDTANAMQKNMQAIQICLPGEKFEIQGVSDLNWKGRKFSGNAMRRGKNYYLFHGTFLYSFDLQQIQTQLGKPDREPDYRAKRSHSEFITNIPAGKEKIIEALKKAWGANDPLKKVPLELIPELKKNFYANPDWNKKF